MLDGQDLRHEQVRQRAQALLAGVQAPLLFEVAPLALDWLVQHDGLQFARLRATQAIWEEQPEDRLGERLLGAVRGLDGGAGYWHCWLISYEAAREEFQLSIGLPASDPVARLAPLLPALRFETGDGERLRAAARHRHQRIVRGTIVSRSRDENYAPQLEQLLELGGDFDWSCWAFLAPAGYARWQAAEAELLGDQELLARELERTVAIGAGNGRRSGGVIARAHALVERQLERLAEGLAQGFWLSTVVLTAADERVDLLATQFTTAFAAPDAVEPLRVQRPAPEGAGGDQRPRLGTGQTTRELSALVTAPRMERPGYRVAPYAPFDLDAGSPSSQPVILGQIVQGERDTRVAYQVGRDALTRHALVAGITGSGKSNSCKLLAGRLGALGVPLLIVEPAKAEYRSLGLPTYTPGAEAVAPIRLNPFELPAVAGPSGWRYAPVQGHIDILKAVFSASFVLFAPMPYILERCLHEIYTDRGWDLASGVNSRGDRPDRLFPTLSDLYDKIDEVVRGLGYDQRLEMDIRAGLLARVESLRIGGRGLLLDTARSAPTIAALLEKSAVLELEAIGNDEEKSFVMGLLLSLVYEYRTLQAAVEREGAGIGSQNPALRHLVLIEEAHRLLASNSRPGGSGDRADVGGQTLTTFANMLAEMRAYGQGFLIVDQVPSRLDPSVIKNTELKIIHKLVAPDDRELLARAASLSDRQSAYVATLRQGYAVVHAGGDDRPFLVHMGAYNGVARAIEPAQAVPPPLAGCTSRCPAWRLRRRCPTQLREIGRRIAARIDERHMLGALIAAADGRPYTLHRSTLHTIRERAQHDTPADIEVVSACAGLHVGEAALSRLERHYPRWPIERSAELLALCLGETAPQSSPQLQVALAQGLSASGPYQICAEQCGQPCRYRLFAERLLLPLRQILGRADLEEAPALVARLAGRYADRLWGAPPSPAAGRAFQTCLLVHLAAGVDPAHIDLVVPEARDLFNLEEAGVTPRTGDERSPSTDKEGVS